MGNQNFNSVILCIFLYIISPKRNLNIFSVKFNSADERPDIGYPHINCIKNLTPVLSVLICFEKIFILYAPGQVPSITNVCISW